MHRNQGHRRKFDLSAKQQAALERLLRVEGMSFSPSSSSISRRAVFSPVGLSFAQERLWFLHQLEDGRPVYHIAETVHFSGRLAVPAFSAALTQLSERHETLRTSIALIAKRPQQVIERYTNIVIPLIDLSALPDDVQASTVQQLIHQESHRPFDLAEGPLLRTHLLYLKPEEHIFLITTHHIISDDWSNTLFYQELAIIYNAICTGQPALLPALSIQYADFALWQRERLQGTRLEELLSYWRKQLIGAPPVLHLVNAHPRPAYQSFAGAAFHFTLSSALSEKLRALNQKEGATLFMTLLAGFSILLARYSGQHDVLIGSPVANRTVPETQGLIGFFVNMLVLRNTVLETLTFQEFLKHVRTVCLEAYEHQDLPFNLLIEDLQPTRALSYNPLVQITFQLLEREQQELPAFTGLIGRREEVVLDTVQADLSLDIIEKQGQLIGQATYSSALFEGKAIEQMMTHFEQLLTNIVATPEQSLGNLSLFSNSEREHLQTLWQGAYAAVPSQRCIHKLFEDQVRRTPDKIALIFHERHITYAELNRRVNQLASLLRTLGVKPEVRVGLYLKRSLEQVIGLLAIFKAGGAYIPIDPALPAQRVAFMLGDASALVLIAHDDLSTQLASAYQTLRLPAEWERVFTQPAINPDYEVLPENLAYLIYTSGSTGTPKAVMVEHAQLSSLLLSCQRQFGSFHEDVMPVLASASFDISLFELLNPLIAGGTVLLLQEHEAMDVQEIMNYLPHCTAFHAVPSLMQQLVSLLKSNMQFQWRCNHLWKVFVGGDSVPPSLLREMQLAFPQAELYVLYGPTETTVICTTYKVPRNAIIESHMIGIPVDNAMLSLFDQWHHIVPLGVVGELYVGGQGVSRGYWKRDELTHEKFLWMGGLRMYRTGDLVRARADGSLEFVGRCDLQLKVRGFRIEPAEIEMRLAQHPAISQAVVLPLPLAATDTGLLAYLLGTSEHPDRPSASQLRLWLQESLPDYMLPARFLWLSALPLTVQGKLDRQALLALPLPASSPLDTLKEITPPRTSLETVIAGIWAEVLHIPFVGIDEDFFTLGGHSLMATQMLIRVDDILRVRLTLRTFFEAPTIAGVAKAILEANQQEATSKNEELGATSKQNLIAILETLDQLSEEEEMALLEELRNIYENH